MRNSVNAVKTLVIKIVVEDTAGGPSVNKFMIILIGSFNREKIVKFAVRC